jgi:hypothetical protein
VDLLTIKRSAGEAEYGQPLPALNAYIDAELARLAAVSPPLPRDTDFSVLDRLLFGTIV